MALDRVDDDFVAYWSRLHVLLAARLPVLTLHLFRDLPRPEAASLAALIEGGKHVRGAVALAVCDALGGETERALESAAAIECIHAASLIHDDFVDGDRVRRGQPAAWVVHGSRRAVLLADVVFATALQRSAELGRREVMTLARSIAMVAAGAYRELRGARDVDRRAAADIYERTIELKTGALFAAAAELGAVAARSKAVVCRAASRFGTLTGGAYQIADDLNDLVRSEARRNGVHDAMLAALLARFDASDSTPPHSDGVSRGVRFDAAGIARAMETEILRRVALATGALAGFPHGSRLSMLRSVPGAVVRSMSGAPPARSDDTVAHVASTAR